MSEEDKADFMQTIKSGSSHYLQMLGNINVEKSECFNEDDKKAIFSVVDTLPRKAHTINAMICEQMREWCLGMLKNVDENASLRDVVRQKSTYATMLTSRGEYNEALALYTEVLGLYKDLDGEESTNVATTYGNMALVYKKQGPSTKRTQNVVETVKSKMK